MKGSDHPELRPTVIGDLEVLFDFQIDDEAKYLAAFTPKDPSDKPAYLEKYTKHLQDPHINMHTILVANRVVGSIAAFELEGKTEVTYWIDRAFWG